MPDQIAAESLPAGASYRTLFQEIRPAGGGEGFALYTAMDGETPVLIEDDSVLAELVDEADWGVTVRRFSTLLARDTYLSHLVAVIDYKALARRQQATFRATLSTAGQGTGDQFTQRHPFIVPEGAEDENLFAALRGPDGARAYFEDRRITWWRNPKSGDRAPGRGPTRNMTSSQIACVNLFLPIREHPALLTALLRTIDSSIVDVAPVPYETKNGAASTSLVELEWTGPHGTLEGGGSRGSRATSADACLIGVTDTGARRLFLIECKYTEQYTEKGGAKGGGELGAARRKRYDHRYRAPNSCFSGAVPFEDVLYEPFYQIVRLGLLADAVSEKHPGLFDATRIAVVCPRENRAYRNRVTSPALRQQFPSSRTVEQVARSLWRDPAGFSMLDPRDLMDSARSATKSLSLEAWSRYIAERYGW
jgi:hypothetical protein